MFFDPFLFCLPSEKSDLRRNLVPQTKCEWTATIVARLMLTAEHAPRRMRGRRRFSGVLVGPAVILVGPDSGLPLLAKTSWAVLLGECR
jgi:hypothetical protein